MKNPNVVVVPVPGWPPDSFLLAGETLYVASERTNEASVAGLRLGALPQPGGHLQRLLKALRLEEQAALAKRD